jgi:hypothetical protein
MKIKLIFSTICLLVFGACNSSTSSPSTAATNPSLRWMDRTIYFAYSSQTDPSRNNEFEKSEIQDALDDVASESSLGSGYFSYVEEDESDLTPSLTLETSATDFQSFIVIWDDADFSNFVVNQLGGSIPDPNALTVINAAYKRKFYMIFKASCFTSSSACNSITSGLGLRAMLARQLGLMTGMSITDCTQNPYNVMCANTPSDSQWAQSITCSSVLDSTTCGNVGCTWDTTSASCGGNTIYSPKNSWVASFNNVLETILNNPNFYEEFVPADPSTTAN